MVWTKLTQTRSTVNVLGLMRGVVWYLHVVCNRYYLP